MKYISQPAVKRDGMGLALGVPAYTDDLPVPGKPLSVFVVRSPHASAYIQSIQTARARAVPGVACVLTYEDVPAVRYAAEGKPYPELCPYDRLILDRWVRYVGDAVAVVAAADRKTAIRAARLLKIEYNVQPCQLDMKHAQDGPAVHAEEGLKTFFDIQFDPKKNVISSYRLENGDMDAAMRGSAVTVKASYRTQAQAHAMMETQRACSYWTPDRRLTVVSSTQCPFNIQRILATALGLPSGRVHVIKPRVGGGFGGKTNAIVEFYPALVTLKTGRPAKLVYTRQEAFQCTTRHAAAFDVTLGADTDGIIRAMDVQSLFDGGAYAEQSAVVLRVAGHKSIPLYNKAQAIRYQGDAVYTNRVPASALRGYGVTQSAFALESAVNRLAAALKMDPTELRLRNIIRAGERNVALEGPKDGLPPQIQSSTLDQCILRGKEIIGWDDKFPSYRTLDGKLRGLGMAITMQGSGVAGLDTSGAVLKLNHDGTYLLLVGSADIGNGSDTILSQIAAEVLQVPTESIVVVSGDTDTTPYDKGAYASCTTYVTGNAVKQAAESLQEKIVDAAARMWQVARDTVLFQGESVSLTDGGEHCTMAELAAWVTKNPNGSLLIGTGMFKAVYSPPPFVAGFAEVEVDCETGKVKPVRFAAVVDCGTLVNPKLARIQAEGGIVQGIGFALYEDVHYGADGKLLTDSFMQYKIPSRRDIPDVQVEFLPSFEPTGPFGAKSIGEVVTNTPAPAIAAAVANAIGAEIHDLPITPEKVLRAIQKSKKPLGV